MKRIHVKYSNKHNQSRYSDHYCRSFDDLPSRMRRLRILQDIVDGTKTYKSCYQAAIHLEALKLAAKEMGGSNAGRQVDARIKMLWARVNIHPSGISSNMHLHVSNR